MKTVCNLIFAGLVANIALIASGALSAVDLSFVASAAEVGTASTTSLIAASAPASSQTA